MPRTKVLKVGRTEAQVMQQILDAAGMLGIDMDRQNTGGFTNPRGQYVPCGQPGNSDLIGVLKDGRAIMVECKAEGFDPSKLSGDKKAHFDRQLERLRKTNRLNGVGFFCDDGEIFLRVMQIVLHGGWVDETGYDGLTVFDPEIEEQT